MLRHAVLQCVPPSSNIQLIEAEALMKFSLTDLAVPVVIAVPAALGGALMVFSEYDDAPGGVLIGLLLIVGAIVLGGWLLRRNR